MMQTSSLSPAVLAIAAGSLLSAGCFDPLVSDPIPDATDESGSSDDTGEDTSTTSPEDPDSDSSGDLPAICGDGIVEGNEQCDDGINDGSYGSCTQDCTALAPHCGDGIINGDEPCDDGDEIDGNGCNIDCVVSGTVLWTVTYDGPENGVDAAVAVASDSEARVLVAGFSSEGWIRVHDTSGEHIWTLDFTSTIGSIATFDDYIISGGSVGPITSRDALVRRISSTGQITWQQTYASPLGGVDLTTDVAIDPMGDIYALIDEDNAPSPSGHRTFVRKYAPDGTELWSLFAEENIRIVDIDTDSAGQIYSLGRRTNGGSADMVVQVLDSESNEIWTQVFPLKAMSNPLLLSTNAQGNTIAVVEAGEIGAEVTSISSEGVAGVSFVPAAGGASFISVSAAHLQDDGFILVGGSAIDGEDVQGWIGKYDSAGNEMWIDTHNGDFDTGFSFDSVLSVRTDHANNVIAVGTILHDANSLSDAWIRKLAP